jgi:transglutaminase-like putative cysteine protease
MQIRIGYEFIYECPQPTPMILTLRVHPTRARDLVTPDELRTGPVVPITRYEDLFGNLCDRIVAPTGETRIFADGIVNDSGEPDAIAPSAIQHPVEELPSDTLVFLLGSRYCEVDLMLGLAWDLFAKTPPGWTRVQAICDFAHEHVVFGYEHARPSRTAREAHAERLGVCRDFTHLAVTLCRCMNIPARYCTGYLGDIGVPVAPFPMDFSAWFEAYLGGRWYTFDARHNTPRIGRVLIARGRDAADVPISTTFGPNTLKKFTVVTDEVVNAEP